MKYKVIVEYEYPVEHKTPVKAELTLHGDSVETWDIKPLEPTTKNDLGVDAISRKQAIEEADKLCLETGYDNEKVIEMLNELPSVTPQEPRKGYISIDDVMSVFDDYMRGEVDGQDTETFLEMLKDKAESEET